MFSCERIEAANIDPALVWALERVFPLGPDGVEVDNYVIPRSP
jgi:hypothetical protein